MDSLIYSDLDPETAALCGYFKPKAEYDVIDPKWSDSFRHINSQTQLIYFPGSFGTFHEGHADICKAALAKYPGAVLVIAPANSDYTVQKYGAWSTWASNKHRYDTIKRMMPYAVIDIEPMLNYVCDHNFTDLLDNFLEIHGLSFGGMTHRPVILCGKDRADFTNLNKYTDKVVVEWFDDTTGASTSALENKTQEKKRLYLRCTNRAEYELFCTHFSDQYTSINPIYIDDEIEIAAAMIANIGITHTICKDYAHLVPYIKTSRSFANPLEDATHVLKDERFTPDMVILDSDIYSGATAKFIRRHGCEFYVLYNYSSATDKVELLDIADFRKPDFCYPNVDISSRCSMQAFDYDFHQRYNAFREELNHE